MLVAAARRPMPAEIAQAPGATRPDIALRGVRTSISPWRSPL